MHRTTFVSPPLPRRLPPEQVEEAIAMYRAMLAEKMAVT